MKVKELEPVAKNKRGKFRKNNVNLVPHEEDTIKHLILYGFTIDAICPTKIPKMKNPDILLDGAIWEIKSPISSNPKTIKKRIHEASEQATRIIVELRRIKGDYDRVEKDIVKRFQTKSVFRKMILIKKDGRVFYYQK